MTAQEIQEIMCSQRAFYDSGATRDVDARLQKLRELRTAMQEREAEIAAALKEDLGKSTQESYMCEIGLAMSEISWLLKHTRTLAKEHRVRTPLAQYVSRSCRKPSPYGAVLIMSPWNYPVLLSIDPLADAIAAGNTVVLKPSAYSPASSRVLTSLVASVFPPEWVSVVTGGRAENTALLDQKWDMIFFTGSQAVGRTVMRAASEHLTPVTLELGGKSPCIVDETAAIPLAAKRIVWGKYLNCGQTCVAPDYILCKEEIKEQLIEELRRQITQQFGTDPLTNPDYGKIINRKHYDRICGLIDTVNDQVPTDERSYASDQTSGSDACPASESDFHAGTSSRVCTMDAIDPHGDAAKSRIAIGGRHSPDTLQIEPTVLTDITWDDAVMQEEIFGPVLPILTYETMEDLPQIVNSRAKPLALYYFSQDKGAIRYVTDRCQFGGGCVNDVVIHLATPYMPFGGVGESGMGCYHGIEGFRTFSHFKSIVDKKTWIDLPMRYQPFRSFYDRIVRLFVR